jgi:hypothetical protein
MESLNLVQTLALLPMTLDTYGLAEDEYLAIFEKKAEFACKALLTVQRVASDYNIKMEPKLFYAYQEGQRIPAGVKIQQDYNIRRARILVKRSVELSPSAYPSEFLPEPEAAD